MANALSTLSIQDQAYDTNRLMTQIMKQVSIVYDYIHQYIR